MEKKPLFLHIGYPKTATTVLQKHYYPRLSGIAYLGIRYGEEPRFSIPSEAVEVLVRGDARRAAEIGPEVSRRLYEELSDQAGLLSLEKIVGSFFTPRRTGGKFSIVSDPNKASEAIAALFSPELFSVRLIVTLRRQTDSLTSKYAQSFTSAYSRVPGFDTFSKFVRDILDNEQSVIRSGFDYDRVLSVFESRFGYDNIAVLPYELFVESPEVFLTKLFGLMEITYYPDQFPINLRENVRRGEGPGKRYSPKSVFNVLGDLKRRFFPRLRVGKIAVLAPLGRLQFPWQKNPGIIALEADDDLRIANLYSDSNRRVAKRYGLNLERYGYCAGG